jgi:hypothetical protein
MGSTLEVHLPYSAHTVYHAVLLLYFETVDSGVGTWQEVEACTGGRLRALLQAEKSVEDLIAEA